MSTKMYNYRVAKDRWWEFANACREFYMAKHPYGKAIRAAAANEGAKYSDLMKIVKAVAAADETVELQVFDEGETYLFRPLEVGWFFMNNCQMWETYGVEAVFYDTRSDVPPEDEKNKAVAEWVDEKILAHEYFMYGLLVHATLEDVCLEALRARVSEAAS